MDLALVVQQVAKVLLCEDYLIVRHRGLCQVNGKFQEVGGDQSISAAK